MIARTSALRLLRKECGRAENSRDIGFTHILEGRTQGWHLALLTAGGLQELVYVGVLQSQLYPLAGGTLGTVAGVFIVWSGIAWFITSQLTRQIVEATAAVSIPAFVLIGFVRPLTG